MMNSDERFTGTTSHPQLFSFLTTGKGSVQHAQLVSFPSSVVPAGGRYMCHGWGDMALCWFIKGNLLACGLVITTTIKCRQGCHLDRFLSRKRLARRNLRCLTINPQLVSVTWEPLL
jgi:hypothetical protein